jgi:hypothetical protein
MKSIIYLIAFFLLPALLNGQENLVIKGQVTDAFTHEPLMDCHVYVSNQTIGTITDEMGNFCIEVPRRYMTQCLIISYVGYEKKIIIIHEIGNKPLDIGLEYAVIALSEIVITPDYHWIIYKAIIETYVRNEPGTSHEKDVILEVMSDDKMKVINTMY